MGKKEKSSNGSHAKNEQNMEVKHSKTEKGKNLKAYVQSIMLFGCSTWSMNKEMERSKDSFNRRMVRHACGIFSPERMSTEKVNALI